jgi:hypothetical protein
MCLVCVSETKAVHTGSLQWLPISEIFPSCEHTVQNTSVRTFLCGKYQLKHIPFEEAIRHVFDIAKEEFVTETEILQSDLLPGKYEGWFSEYFNALQYLYQYIVTL